MKLINDAEWQESRQLRADALPGKEQRPIKIEDHGVLNMAQQCSQKLKTVRIMDSWRPPFSGNYCISKRPTSRKCIRSSFRDASASILDSVCYSSPSLPSILGIKSLFWRCFRAPQGLTLSAITAHLLSGTWPSALPTKTSCYTAPSRPRMRAFF